jgi:hypothetical protein
VIEIEDLLLIAGLIVLLVVAFHYGIWIGIALVGMYLIVAAWQVGKIKARKGKI